jgi:hypothetical protein
MYGVANSEASLALPQQMQGFGGWIQAACEYESPQDKAKEASTGWGPGPGRRVGLYGVLIIGEVYSILG